MRLLGRVGGHQVAILIDSGSSHNFVDASLIRKLKLPVETYKGLKVQIANGEKMICVGKCVGMVLDLPRYNMASDFYILQLEEFDIVLGIQWLKTLGSILWNFESLTMSFMENGKTVELKGQLTPKVTKDGVKVVESNEVQDRVKNMGTRLVKQVANATNDLVGDGITCATILTCAIFAKGCKFVAVGMNAMDLRCGITMVINAAVTNLKSRTRMISTSEEIAQVGTMSSNGEREIGELIAKAMEKVVQEGVMTIVDGKILYNELEFVEGMKLDRGYISPYFIMNPKTQKCELEDPLILVHEKKISNINVVVRVLELTLKRQRPLLIVAEDVESDALATLILNKLREGIKVCCIKALEFGENRKANLHDLATLTGAQVVTDELGLNLEKVDLDVLGIAKTGEVRGAVICLIDHEREGEQIDRALLKNVLDIFVEIGMGSMEYYVNDFEDAMLKDTASYYSRKASNWILENSCPYYMLKAEACLKREKDRVAHYLHSSSEHKLLEKVQHELLTAYANQLLEQEHSGCHVLLRDDKVGDLSGMYRLFFKVPKGLEPVTHIFKQHITDEGMAWVKQAEDAANNKNVEKRDVVGLQKQIFSREVIELHDKYLAYVNDCYTNHSLFHKALKEAFEVFCNMETSMLSFLLFFVTIFLRKESVEPKCLLFLLWKIGK